jgi:hypothetical protein
MIRGVEEEGGGGGVRKAAGLTLNVRDTAPFCTFAEVRNSAPNSRPHSRGKYRIAHLYYFACSFTPRRERGGTRAQA